MWLFFLFLPLYLLSLSVCVIYSPIDYISLVSVYVLSHSLSLSVDVIIVFCFTIIITSKRLCVNFLSLYLILYVFHDAAVISFSANIATNQSTGSALLLLSMFNQHNRNDDDEDCSNHFSALKRF